MIHRIVGHLEPRGHNGDRRQHHKHVFHVKQSLHAYSRTTRPAGSTNNAARRPRSYLKPNSNPPSTHPHFDPNRLSSSNCFT